MGYGSIAGLALVLACSHGSALAQNDTQGAPQSAAKAGDDAASDPSGAVRSLSAASEGGSKERQPPVKIPHMGGESDRTSGLPAGTTGPGR